MTANLTWTPPATEERKIMVLPDPRRSMAAYSTTIRQVGWVGQTGTVYAMDEKPTEPGGFTALWIEVGAE